MEFKLTASQNQRLVQWVQEQDEKARIKQNRPFGPSFGGACSDAYKYTFQDTLVGIIVHVTNLITNEELDLTEYEPFE